MTVSLVSLKAAGFTPTANVATEVTAWTSSNAFTITSTNSSAGLGTPTATYAVTGGLLAVTPAAQ